MYLIGHELTAQFKYYVRLIDLLPNGELCIISQPRESPEQRIILSILSLMEIGDMSELSYQLQQLTNEELIDFALKHLGQHEAIRHAALQEHFLRVKDAPDTIKATAGDTEILRAKLAQLTKYS